MSHRPASRPLTGHVWPIHREPDIRYGQHERGYPAVTIDLKSTRETRTFNRVEDLRSLARDISEAADWLEAQLT